MIKILIILFISLIGFNIQAKDHDNGLLLAMSLWGECGVDCSAVEKNIIYNIYVKKQAVGGWGLRRVILNYSGVMKKRKGHPKPWILRLNRDLTKPDRWNPEASWPKHKDKWDRLLESADYLIEHNPPDECPECTEFCGRFERHIAHWSLTEVKLKLRNLYWRKR